VDDVGGGRGWGVVGFGDGVGGDLLGDFFGHEVSLEKLDCKVRKISVNQILNMFFLWCFLKLLLVQYSHQ
jgi:hypothetical protein